MQLFCFQDGKVPLCLAAAAGHYDVLNYLLKKEHDTYTLMNDSSVSILIEKVHFSPTKKNHFEYYYAS